MNESTTRPEPETIILLKGEISASRLAELRVFALEPRYTSGSRSGFPAKLWVAASRAADGTPAAREAEMVHGPRLSVHEMRQSGRVYGIGEDRAITLSCAISKIGPPPQEGERPRWLFADLLRGRWNEETNQFVGTVLPPRAATWVGNLYKKLPSLPVDSRPWRATTREIESIEAQYGCPVRMEAALGAAHLAIKADNAPRHRPSAPRGMRF